MTRRQALLVSLFVTVLLAHPVAQNNPQATSGSWRPTIVAQHGMVAAGHPLAAEAGMRILKAGGNAVDAAIATWAVQGEVEPGMTGLGADMFVLYYNAKTREVKFINGTGFAAQTATIDYYKSKGEKVAVEIVTFGPGLHMLRADTSPVKDRIAVMSLENANVTFAACGNTQANQSKAENKPVVLISEAKVTPSGVVRLMELQQQGYAYLRP